MSICGKLKRATLFQISHTTANLYSFTFLVGDSYLAVCGLPEPEPDHAIVMVRFAWDCFVKMNQVMRELEVQLGPDTGDLSMRFGLHSGPVTAGVLRGERAVRFSAQSFMVILTRYK